MLLDGCQDAPACRLAQVWHRQIRQVDRRRVHRSPIYVHRPYHEWPDRSEAILASMHMLRSLLSAVLTRPAIAICHKGIMLTSASCAQ